MANREEKRNLETIPVGSLGIISLPGCKVIREIPICWMQRCPVSVPAKQKVRS